MAEFSFTPDVETPEIDSSEFSFTPDENQETAKINVDNYNGMDLVGEPGEDAKPYSKMDLFFKNLFTFDVKSGEEVKERQQNNPRIQALEKVRQEGFDDVKWGEVGKSLVKGSLELGKSMTASPFKIYGDWSMDERDTSLMTPKEADEVKFNNFRAQSYVKFGEYIGKIWDMGINADWLKEDEETFKGTFVENPSMTRVLSLGASAIPSVTVFGLTSKITGSRKAASVLLAGADNDDLYFEAREAGESQNKALALYATGTAGTAALEKYGFDQIFNQRVTAPFAKRVRNAVLAEGFTEGFQTGYQNAVKKYGYDETQELLEGVLESVIAGALSGGAISAADAGYVKLQNARGKLKDKGATDEALDMMQEEFARELSYHRDTIEPMFQTKITESLNNLDKFVKEHEGTAEAQKALKTKAELDEVYNLVNKSLTDNGVNAEVANADAKVWQGIALWGSQETGLSPMEYINQRMPKVQQKRLAEFLNEREKRVATSNESELEILRQDINRLKKGVSRKASNGLRLSQFIKKMGGINDDRGDIKAMGSSVGLLNKNGISLDEATQMAWDAGYIQSTERPDVNQLLDLLSDDLGNKPVYSFNDNVKGDDRQYYLSLERALDEAGADINKDSLEVINQKLNDYKNSFAREDVAQYDPELDDFIPFQTGVAEIDNSRLYQNLPQNIKDAVDFVFNTAAIKEISGNEFQKDGIPLTDKVTKFYEDEYNGKAHNPELGDVKLDREGVKDSLGHGIGSKKAAAYALVPEVIEKGFIFNRETNWKGRGYDTAVLIAPVKIGTEDYICEVVVKQGAERQGFYLHEVELTKKLADVFKTANGSTSTSFKLIISQHIENVKKNLQSQDIDLKQYDPREDIPNVRGGWTKAKILKYLKDNGSLRGVGTATRMIAEFDSVEDFKSHMFYHGAKYGTSGRMKPSITMSDREVENVGGGGYGDKYWAISLSKSKKVAGNFATASGNGSIYPVLLVKNAKVIEMPELDDSADLEDHIEQLYADGVDAVWIGDKDSGEQELAVINPKAIVNIGTSEFYKAYKLGSAENPINIRSDEEIQKIFDYAKDFTNKFPKTAPDEKIEEAKGVIRWQSAFHGTPHAELEGGSFKLEKIGTGENAQAHGYGLYYAASYDVADKRYRERLTKPYTWFISFGEVEFDKKTGKYKNAFNETTLEFEVYKDFKLDAGEDIDVLLKSYEQTRFLDDRTDEKIAIVNKYKDYFVNNDVHNFSDESMAKGQVYEVDLPENPYLLDEQKTYDEQSDHVKQQLMALWDNLVIDDAKIVNLTGSKTNPYKNVARHKTGREIYKDLASILGSDKAASHLLEEYDIRGITYDGRQDGRCFVIFNPDDVKVIQKFYQDAGRPKGAFAQNLDQKGVIYLFEDADASTFMHETAHFFRKELEEFGTARSKEMLQKMVEWENSEFDKRYNVQQTANGFVVTDKLGNVVYGDKKPFQSVQSAREYGRNEIFARGFEQYLRDGKAPSNYLKQAFRSFWSWLRSLYKSAKDLNVEINDNIRSVYNEIIGGADLDFYLSAPVDEVLQQRVAESKDREEYLEDVIKRAQANPYKGITGWVKEKTESNKGLVKWWNAAIVPISTRAKRVNIKLRNRLRAYDYAVNNKYNEYIAQVKPFLDKWEKFSEQDTIAFDLALKNSYMKKQIDIVNKYGAYEEFVQVKNLLNRLFDQAIDVGVELGYTADYFPRQVEDVDGFMAYLHGSAMASQMRRALKDADPTNTFTNEEKAEFINKYLRGFNRKDLNKPLPGNTKDRIIDVITPEMNKYYKPSIQALISYIDGMNQSIESRRFWGFEYESINDSIGSLTSYLVDTGVIQPEQDAEVQEILKARFKAKGVTNKYLKKQKNFSYIYLMGGINSAITQIEDISVAIYKAGFWNTATSVFSKNRVGLSREELGLEKIGQEFVEASTSSKAVSRVFKLTGLDKIDAFGKNTLINATFNKFQDMANKDEGALRARLEPILEGETNQTIQDIKNGEISENVKLLMFNELADMQPISLSEMPEWYLTSGNGRVFYMLKTFALKRIDIFRNECFDKIRQGDVKTGIQNLFRLSMLMILCGMSKDAIINMLYGRDMDLSEMFINNLLGLTGIVSKYSLYKARDEGFSGFLSSVAIPPLFAMPSDLIGDIYKSLFTAKGKDISDYEVWKGVPLVGRFYYWWLGGGRTKIEKKKNKKLK